MNVLDFWFIVCMIGTTALMLYRLYNIFNVATIYQPQISWIMFIGSLLLYFICFVVFMIDAEKIIYIILFNASKLIFILNIFFFVIEQLIYMVLSIEQPIGPHKEIENIKAKMAQNP